jgi:biotin operon repressor
VTETLFGAERLTPQQTTIIDVLTRAGGEWVSGIVFNDRYRIFAYSQRVGELKKLGYAIETDRHGGVARYRLRRAS